MVPTASSEEGLSERPAAAVSKPPPTSIAIVAASHTVVSNVNLKRQSLHSRTTQMRKSESRQPLANHRYTIRRRHTRRSEGFLARTGSRRRARIRACE